MQITVMRSGGFAGITEELGAVATETLGEDGLELERLVSEARFFELPSELPGDAGADMFRYEVTVVEEGRSHTVAYSGEGDDAPEPLRQLVAKVSGS
jgi:hypothetical protein